MFLMNAKTVSRWLVMTEFEMLMQMLAFTVFSVLLCIRLDYCSNHDDHDFAATACGLKWFHVFLPLFVVDVLQANFITIVFMRQLKENQSKEGIMRLFFSVLFLKSRLVFKAAIYSLVSQYTFKSNDITQEITAKMRVRFQHAATPIFFHLSVLMFRSCCLKKYQSFS